MKIKNIGVNLLLLRHRMQLALSVIGGKKSPFKVHVIGDSHSSFCFTNVKPVATKLERSLFRYRADGDVLNIPFAVHWLGPVTMFRVGRDGFQAVDLKALKVEESAVVVFVFGEIDVRCHIEKQSIAQGKEIDEIIDSLAESYVKTIVANRRSFKDIHCVVCSVVPPTDNILNSRFPFYGSLQTRVAITKKLNKKLYDISKHNSIDFIDLYNPHSTEDGDLRHEFCHGDVHISPRYNGPIKQQLIRLAISRRV